MLKSRIGLIAGTVLIVGAGLFFVLNKNISGNVKTLKNRSINTISEKKEAIVPLPQEEDIVRSFFEIINEKRPSDAISMMSQKLIGDESEKQSWGVQFNDLDSIKVLNIEKTTVNNFYKVNLEVKVNPRAANAPIPYYGWGENPNTRFIKLIKNSEGIWKIDEIATGL